MILDFAKKHSRHASLPLHVLYASRGHWFVRCPDAAVVRGLAHTVNEPHAAFVHCAKP
jgi:hypothetical protein